MWGLVLERLGMYLVLCSIALWLPMFFRDFQLTPVESATHVGKLICTFADKTKTCRKL